MTTSKRRRSPKPEAQGERLQKILAAAGVASRRACEELIREGRVSVNGRKVLELGVRARADRDRILVDGRRVRTSRRRKYYAIYKPRGVVSTTNDPNARRTVLDLVRSRERLFPVGRLDAASEGLLILTNDGDLAQVFLHPSFQVPRTYKVSVSGRVRAQTLRKLSQGIELDGVLTAPCKVLILEQADDRSLLEMTMAEGRKRQIREMMAAVDHPVRRLLRVRFGPVRLSGLRSGESRPLTDQEIEAVGRMIAQARSAPPAARRQLGR